MADKNKYGIMLTLSGSQVWVPENPKHFTNNEPPKLYDTYEEVQEAAKQWNDPMIVVVREARPSREIRDMTPAERMRAKERYDNNRA